jgi:26S proteasome regulatory subunit N6
LAIDIITPLLEELRKADDKHLLIEAWMIESKVYYKLENYAKSRASLTAARASSNSIYI